MQRNFAGKIVRKDFTKRILAEKYIRPDEAQKIIAKLREKGKYIAIDRVSRTFEYQGRHLRNRVFEFRDKASSAISEIMKDFIFI